MEKMNSLSATNRVWSISTIRIFGHSNRLKLNAWTLGMLFWFLSCDSPKPFQFVLLPDTQCYAAFHPEIFYAQTEWIAANKDSLAFVLHQGDITSRNSLPHWQVAEKALRMLDGKLTYVLATGNHDIGDDGTSNTRNTDMFNQHFPFERQSLAQGFGGVYEAGKMDNSWYVFQTGGLDWLVVNLEFGPRNKVLTWANEVIRSHSKYRVIINTHAYMYSDDTRIGASTDHRWLPQNYGIGKDVAEDDEVNDGEALWDKLVSLHANIIMVFSGHVLNDGVGTLVSQGVHGNLVYQMLANYQCGVDGSENGGNGFLRIITVDPAKHSIGVQSYSPYLDSVLTSPDHTFMFHDVNFER